VGCVKSPGKIGAKLGTRALTFNILSDEDISDGISDVITAATDDLVDQTLKSFLAKADSRKSLSEKFRGELSKLSTTLPLMQNDQLKKPHDNSKGLVFIIDDLDRCRPPFALEIIETIKHFFAVDGLHFVLGVDLEQLENSIQAAYGTSMNGRRYLEKFIHVTLPLKGETKQGKQPPRIIYIDFLHESLLKNAPRQDVVRAANLMLQHLANVHNLQLWTIGRIYSIIATALAVNANRDDIDGTIVAALAALKVLEPSLFATALYGKPLQTDFLDFLQLQNLQGNSETRRFGDWQLKIWNYILRPDQAVVEMLSEV
ncbi:MAG: P-loop NTPase fold protein, partial [Pseudomonadota bacterium]